jgi:DNA-binding transcriptional MocR family regulator
VASRRAALQAGPDRRGERFAVGHDLCARLLLGPGDRVVIENPGYNLARQAFSAVGADVIPIAVDREGMWTRELPRDAAGIYHAVPPVPSRRVMSAGRRRDLLAWAQRSRAYIVEGDYDSEYRVDIASIPPLQALMVPDGLSTWGRSPRPSRRPCASAISSPRRC